MSAAAIKAMEISEEEFSKKFSFLNRFALPREVAQGSLWLTSDASSYVTGIAMPIDGGCLAK